ncbi:bactofilin family protein [Teredinibacter purpureus]|jgi:Integral membrane protein CcmA involved in cell shape determination|uniref:bactofilin family protein n=1 Tax=Teredinibacter purpureus TaxID=2731756 RepID=UPI0005F8782B|nr:polymer-forming cytoskeletal protein [Teredinibacter purpureus]
MFSKKKDNPFAQGGHTLFDNALEINGDVRFGGTLDIEGSVNGNITAEAAGDALVRVRAKGEVTGEIHAPKIIINGHVNGDVFCSKHLELAANAVVNGNVHYKVIEMVKGAEVNGKLVHMQEDSAKVAVPVPAAPARVAEVSAVPKAST